MKKKTVKWNKNSQLIRHALRELELSGLFSLDDYEKNIAYNVLELLNLFSKQGHSGFSAGIVSKLFYKLSKYETLTPLTLNQEEWMMISEGMFQNVRNSGVFKDAPDGRPYYIDAYIKIAIHPDRRRSSWNGTLELEEGKKVAKCYIKDSTKMPTIPIEVPIKEENGDWTFLPVKEEALHELKKYYDLEII